MVGSSVEFRHDGDFGKTNHLNVSWHDKHTTLTDWLTDGARVKPSLNDDVQQASRCVWQTDGRSRIRP